MCVLSGQNILVSGATQSGNVLLLPTFDPGEDPLISNSFSYCLVRGVRRGDLIDLKLVVITRSHRIEIHSTNSPWLRWWLRLNQASAG
jgi:hypothetical protein